MKKIILGLALISVSALATESTSIIFNELILKRDTKGEMGLQLTVNRNNISWCLGYGHQLSIGNLEVAEKIDLLRDGLYKCEGKFVQLRAEHIASVQAFEIGTCTEINPLVLKAECPVNK